ncbi:lipoprotein [Mycoplasma sp. 06067-C1-B144P-99-0482-3]|uniref:lipoprotein n=1 Tax=Mycoplasma sp. 06067-C1-B144P-99-0482-3 TaxID=3117438 RepID=UPI003DA30ED4
MKKLLTLLGSISVVASGGVVAVACGNAPTNDKIDRAKGEQADQAQKDGKAPNSGEQADQAQKDGKAPNSGEQADRAQKGEAGGSNGEQNDKQLSKTKSYNLTQEEIRDNLIKEEKKNKELREKRKEKLENFKKTNEYKYYE